MESLNLEMHVASQEEQTQAFRNVHDVWSGGLSVDEHLRRRLASIQHQRAKWIVGTVDGNVVASLGVYPMRFQWNGESKTGFAIGAVHTLSKFRGQGFAPRLIDYAETVERSRGATLSLLYSDIKPEYYARMGYVLCPSMEGWRSIERSGSIAASQLKKDLDEDRFRIEQFSPADNATKLIQLYESSSAPCPFSIQRDSDYWDFLIAKSPDDLFYFLKNEEDRTLGYIRLSWNDRTLKIRDFALEQNVSDSVEGLFQGAVRLAEQLKAKKIGGWLPSTPTTRSIFSLQERRLEVTMVKSLCGDVKIDDRVIAAAEYFHEIDHV